MELHGEEVPLLVPERGEWTGRGASDGAESGGRLIDPIRVGHPDVYLLALTEGLEDACGLQNLDARGSVFAVVRFGDPPAQELRHELLAVADAQHRHPQREDPGVHHGGAFRLHRRGATRKDNALRAPGLHLIERHRAGMDLAVDVQRPHSPGNELECTLRSEIEDEESLGMLHRRQFSRW